MKYYFQQVAPEMGWTKVKEKLWKSVDVFGKEGSSEKEEGIKKRVKNIKQ